MKVIRRSVKLRTFVAVVVSNRSFTHFTKKSHQYEKASSVLEGSGHLLKD